MRDTACKGRGVKVTMKLNMKCHKCGYVAEAASSGPSAWQKITQHRRTCDADNYVNGIPFWMLEVRLLDKEFAEIWTTASEASRRALGMGRLC